MIDSLHCSSFSPAAPAATAPSRARAFPFPGLGAHRHRSRAEGSMRENVVPPATCSMQQTNIGLAPGIREYNTLFIGVRYS